MNCFSDVLELCSDRVHCLQDCPVSIWRANDAIKPFQAGDQRSYGIGAQLDVDDAPSQPVSQLLTDLTV